MNRHFFKMRAAAIRDLEGRPCEWEGCGQPSNHYTLQGTQLRPLCPTHTIMAARYGFDVRCIHVKRGGGE